VTYSDIGPDQRLSFPGILRMLQEAAALASDQCGYGLKDTDRNGVCWLLTGWRVEFLDRPGWTAPIRVETWPRTFDGFLSDRDFLVWSGDTLAAKGTSRWFLVSTTTWRITRITDEIRAAYSIDTASVFDAPPPSNGRTPDDAAVTFTPVAGRRDIDTNRHVNNIHYLDYALEALPEEVFQNLPANVEIAYRKQILHGTAIRCLYCLTEDGKHQVEIRSGEGKETVHHAYLWFY